MQTPFKLTRRMALVLAMAPISFLGTMMAAGGAEARENYALIVADSDYPNLDEKYWLKGPKNDEVLVRDYLLSSAPVKFEPQNVVTLGSGEGLQLGTHQAILDNLARIAGEARKGDFVYLHFSGHGSQQPAKDDKSEADGRDEVFLSADTEMAPKDNPTFMPNVLTDDEIGTALKAIRKTGAFVWVVFDSCHSGTVTRGAPEDADAAERKIDPADLGIPDSAFAQPAESDDGSERAVPLAADAYADDEADPDMGGLVAFFAAQSTETTQERGFDVPQPDGTIAKVPYGVFTYTLFSTLARNPGITYRQLAQSILANYAAGNVLKPTPLFEGKLDAPVFGSEDAASAEQWPTVVGLNNAITISAGQLQGLAAGSKLLLLPNPAASDDQAIGLMQVSQATQLRSTLVPASDDKHPLIEASAVPVGAYVRLAEVSYPFELTVSKPDPATTDAAQVAAVEAALASIQADSSAQLKLKVVAPSDTADVRLAVLSDDQVDRLGGGSKTPQSAGIDVTPKLWLLPSDGAVSLEPQRRAPSLALPASATARDASFEKGLEDKLTTIFRATSLSRLTQASTYKPKDFTLNFSLQAAGQNTVAALDATQSPIVRQGDRLYVDFTNSSGKPADLNVLYVDHDYGITLLCQSHLAPNDHLFAPMADLGDSDLGAERIVAVVNESGKDLTDLHFLEQPGLPVTTRGTDQEGLLGMLTDLGSGVPTRGPTIVATADTKTPRGAVVMVPLEVRDATGEDPAAGIAIDQPAEGSCTI